MVGDPAALLFLDHWRINLKVSFVGLGKLGLPLAAMFARSGVTVSGIDINEKVVRSVNAGVAPFFEPGLQELLGDARSNFMCRNDYSHVPSTDATIILVNTPSKAADGSFSNEYIRDALTASSQEIRKSGKRSHIFIISSTVMPGSSVNEFIPQIQEVSGLEYGTEFGLAYVPDFVALGKVIENFAKPDFLLIGSNDHLSRECARILYSRIVNKDTPIQTLSIQEAEISKVALNAYICTKISFANFLGSIAQKFQNVNVDSITSTIGLDSRIGGKYFKAGLPFGGTCFPRDTWAFLRMAESVGLTAEQMHSTERQNRSHFEYFANLAIKSSLCGQRTIGLIGVSFKPGSPVITESLATHIADRAAVDGNEILYYDPLPEAGENFGARFAKYVNVKQARSIAELIKGSSVIVVSYESEEIRSSSLSENYLQSKIFIDPWRFLDGRASNIEQFGVGRFEK